MDISVEKRPTREKKLRILIVDDHEVVREGLRATLNADPSYEVVGDAGDGDTAIHRAKQTLPDVVLLDLRLPDISGEGLCRRLRKLLPSARIIVLTTYLSEGTVRSSLEAGASAYVTKAAGLSGLRAALDQVDSDSDPQLDESSQIVDYLHSVIAGRVDQSAATPQQQQVLELAANGLTNQQIADQLFISESTVRFHIARLKEKLSVNTKTGLVAKAIRMGLIPPAPEDDVDGI